MCRHYAPTKPDACDEDDAVEVKNKTSANFCDYFSPDAGVFDGKEKKAENEARRQLDALFGRAEAESGGQASETARDPALEAAEKLFRK